MIEYLPYAAIIIAVLGFFVQFNIFVTPEKLEKKHREILSDADKKFPCRFSSISRMMSKKISRSLNADKGK